MRAAQRDASVSPSDSPPERTPPERRQRTETVRRRRSLPPGIVPGLLRTRPAASGEFFVVHAKAPETVSLQGVLIIAVPKRVLRRAVDRNAMRRVAREAWRAAQLDAAPIVAMLRMKRAPASPGVPAGRGAVAAMSATARKRLARSELDRLFRALGARWGLAPASR